MTTERLNIVIPMKGLNRSKQRLRSVLTNDQRETLALSLFRETLRFFVHHYPMHHVLVVTECSAIALQAKSFNVSVLYEPTNRSLNGALNLATIWSKENHYSHQLIIPADIGHLDKQELDMVLAKRQQHDVVIVTAKDMGTNALLCSPPDAIEFCFGHQSSTKHAQQAHRAGLIPEILTLPDLSLDIDNGQDLQRWSFPVYGDYTYE
ncbi:2-phospho-L-lactate guanylyltransferase [Vibrio salinus]|uniref:2-phospho-L-lactate guanylyltransferase n=1 Tax=Vibrio salinus TaxID=2899784 RepID=UPI001E54CA40|nr:2-phospho-L-lactate guanylyltransferase [Vibrio salinus]MCE0493693.1 2-phospho-L-lactate guanylyltransferase [Vibrio salinus]